MAVKQFSYRDYVTDGEFSARYSEYRKRYERNIRESDRVLLELVREALEGRDDLCGPARLLDIGCSTGNFLVHLRRAFPDLELAGGDLMESALEECRNNPLLKGVRFERQNILDLQCDERFDIVTANAVLYMFDDDEFERAIRSIAAVLKEGGHLLAFDFFHPFCQHLAIRETSASHPDGLMLHFRPIDETRSLLAKHGFLETSIKPFRIPIDLPKGETLSSNEDGFEDLNSYTVKTEDGERLLFRGALFQPWCHLVARKKS